MTLPPKTSMDHPSEEARKEYLSHHPKADPSQHRVKLIKDMGKPKKEKKEKPFQLMRDMGKPKKVREPSPKKEKPKPSEGKKEPTKLIRDMAKPKKEKKEPFKLMRDMGKKEKTASDHLLRDFQEAVLASTVALKYAARKK
jgi:hypothetical protein